MTRIVSGIFQKNVLNNAAIHMTRVLCPYVDPGCSGENMKPRRTPYTCSLKNCRFSNLIIRH